MIPLHQLQKRFVASMVLNVTDPVLFSVFSTLPRNSFSVHQRFDVYRHNREENLVKTLKNIYPVCCSLVGELCFRMLALVFIQGSISKDFSLNSFGKDFSLFIEKYAREWSLPYLPDIVRLEWLIHLTLLGPPNARLAYETLLSIPEKQQPEVIFRLAENGNLFFSPFPVDKIWEAHQVTEQDVEIKGLNTQIFIYRETIDDAICLASLNLLEWQLLKGIEAGKTLEELYKNLTETEEQEVVLALASCVQKGYVTHAYVESVVLED